MKIGESDDIFDRKNTLVTEYGVIYLLDVFPLDRAHDLEQELLKVPSISKRIYKEEIKGNLHKEVVELDDTFTYDDLLTLVKAKLDFYKENEIRRDMIRLKELENERDQIQLEKEKLKIEKEKNADDKETIELLKTEDVKKLLKKLNINQDEDKYEDESIEEISIASSSTDPTPPITSRKNSRGYFVQRVSETDLTKVLGSYDSQIVAIRGVPGASKSRINSAMKSNEIYMKSRWVKVPEGQDRTVSHCVTPTAVTRSQKTGPVAKLTKDLKEIKLVFKTQREAMKEAQLKSPGAISTAIKFGSPCAYHYYKMWEDCPDELKEVYELKNGKVQFESSNPTGKSINQLDPVTRVIVRKFDTIEQIVKDFAVNRNTLKIAIENQLPIGKFLWEFVKEKK